MLLLLPLLPCDLLRHFLLLLLLLLLLGPLPPARLLGGGEGSVGGRQAVAPQPHPPRLGPHRQQAATAGAVRLPSSPTAAGAAAAVAGRWAGVKEGGPGCAEGGSAQQAGLVGGVGEAGGAPRGAQAHRCGGDGELRGLRRWGWGSEVRGSGPQGGGGRLGRLPRLRDGNERPNQLARPG